MPVRRKGKGPGGGQFLPGEHCEEVIAEEPLEVPAFTPCLPEESAERAAKRQAMLDAIKEARRTEDEYGRVMDEAVASGDARADKPELVAARQKALEATRKSLQLEQEFYGEGPAIPSTTCRNCGKTLDSDRSMPGKVAGYSDPQDRCPVCARYLDGYKYPDP